MTGALSDKPLQENTWGGMRSKNKVHYHDDGPIGSAIQAMGPDRHMDVDGEPLANVLGEIATDVVTGNRTAQQGVDDLKALHERLPERTAGRSCSSACGSPTWTPRPPPVPGTPVGTPEPLQELVRKLHAVPIARKEPNKELEPLLDICDRIASGRSASSLASDVKRLRNKRHESLGDCGKYEIDRAIDDAAKALKTQPPSTPDLGPQTSGVRHVHGGDVTVIDTATGPLGHLRRPFLWSSIAGVVLLVVAAPMTVIAWTIPLALLG